MRWVALRHGIARVLVVCALTTNSGAQTSVGTSFTYQGRVLADGVPHSGTVEVSFDLYDTETSGTPLNPAPLVATVHPDAQGHFTVDLDFGDVFGGEARWLEITVAGSTLSPRQLMSPAPYALYALRGMSPWERVDTSDIAYTDGAVGVGVPAPLWPLHVESHAERSLYSLNMASGGASYGVFAEATGPQGRGIFARGGAYGVFGKNESDTGTGVFGLATGSGLNYGVWGKTLSADGYAAYFEGGRNYFEGNVGIGTSSPSTKLDVAGSVSFSGFVFVGSLEDAHLLMDNNEIMARNNYEGAPLYVNLEGGAVIISSGTPSQAFLGVGVEDPSHRIDVFGGAYCDGSGWYPVSDRAAKHTIEPANTRAVLEQLARLPISSWSYKTDDPSVRHLGPMAQDFHATFGLGASSKAISTIDTDGVALAAIQGLHGMVSEQRERIESLQKENRTMRDRLARLEMIVGRLLGTEGGGVR